MAITMNVIKLQGNQSDSYNFSKCFRGWNQSFDEIGVLLILPFWHRRHECRPAGGEDAEVL